MREIKKKKGDELKVAVYVETKGEGQLSLKGRPCYAGDHYYRAGFPKGS